MWMKKLFSMGPDSKARGRRLPGMSACLSEGFNRYFFVVPYVDDGPSPCFHECNGQPPVRAV